MTSDEDMSDIANLFLSDIENRSGGRKSSNSSAVEAKKWSSIGAQFSFKSILTQTSQQDRKKAGGTMNTILQRIKARADEIDTNVGGPGDGDSEREDEEAGHGNDNSSSNSSINRNNDCQNYSCTKSHEKIGKTGSNNLSWRRRSTVHEESKHYTHHSSNPHDGSSGGDRGTDNGGGGNGGQGGHDREETSEKVYTDKKSNNDSSVTTTSTFVSVQGPLLFSPSISSPSSVSSPASPVASASPASPHKQSHMTNCDKDRGDIKEDSVGDGDVHNADSDNASPPVELEQERRESSLIQNVKEGDENNNDDEDVGDGCRIESAHGDASENNKKRSHLHNEDHSKEVDVSTAGLVQRLRMMAMQQREREKEKKKENDENMLSPVPTSSLRRSHSTPSQPTQASAKLPSSQAIRSHPHHHGKEGKRERTKTDKRSSSPMPASQISGSGSGRKKENDVTPEREKERRIHQIRKYRKMIRRRERELERERLLHRPSMEGWKDERMIDVIQRLKKERPEIFMDSPSTLTAISASSSATMTANISPGSLQNTHSTNASFRGSFNTLPQEASRMLSSHSYAYPEQVQVDTPRKDMSGSRDEIQAVKSQAIDGRNDIDGSEQVAGEKTRQREEEEMEEAKALALEAKMMRKYMRRNYPQIKHRRKKCRSLSQALDYSQLFEQNSTAHDKSERANAKGGLWSPSSKYDSLRNREHLSGGFHDVADQHTYKNTSYVADDNAGVRSKRRQFGSYNSKDLRRCAQINANNGNLAKGHIPRTVARSQQHHQISHYQTMISNMKFDKRRSRNRDKHKSRDRGRDKGNDRDRETKSGKERGTSREHKSGRDSRGKKEGDTDMLREFAGRKKRQNHSNSSLLSVHAHARKGGLPPVSPQSLRTSLRQRPLPTRSHSQSPSQAHFSSNLTIQQSSSNGIANIHTRPHEHASFPQRASCNNSTPPLSTLTKTSRTAGKGDAYLHNDSNNGSSSFDSDSSSIRRSSSLNNMSSIFSRRHVERENRRIKLEKKRERLLQRLGRYDQGDKARIANAYSTLGGNVPVLDHSLDHRHYRSLPRSYTHESNRHMNYGIRDAPPQLRSQTLTHAGSMKDLKDEYYNGRNVDSRRRRRRKSAEKKRGKPTHTDPLSASPSIRLRTLAHYNNHRVGHVSELSMQSYNSQATSRSPVRVRGYHPDGQDSFAIPIEDYNMKEALFSSSLHRSSPDPRPTPPPSLPSSSAPKRAISASASLVRTPPYHLPLACSETANCGTTHQGYTSKAGARVPAHVTSQTGATVQGVASRKVFRSTTARAKYAAAKQRVVLGKGLKSRSLPSALPAAVQKQLQATRTGSGSGSVKGAFRQNCNGKGPNSSRRGLRPVGEKPCTRAEKQAQIQALKQSLKRSHMQAVYMDDSNSEGEGLDVEMLISGLVDSDLSSDFEDVRGGLKGLSPISQTSNTDSLPPPLSISTTNLLLSISRQEQPQAIPQALGRSSRTRSPSSSPSPFDFHRARAKGQNPNANVSEASGEGMGLGGKSSVPTATSAHLPPCHSKVPSATSLPSKATIATKSNTVVSEFPYRETERSCVKSEKKYRQQLQHVDKNLAQNITPVKVKDRGVLQKQSLFLVAMFISSAVVLALSMWLMH